MDCEKVFCNLYWKLRQVLAITILMFSYYFICSSSGGAEKVNEDLMFNINDDHEKQPIICRFGQWILMLFINRFPNLHKMDNLVVDCKQRTVKFLSSNSLHSVLKTDRRNAESFKLSNWEFEKFNTILKNRENTKSEQDQVITKQIQDINARFDRLEEMMLQNMRAIEVLLNK